MGRGPGFEFTATGLKEKSQLVLAAPGSRCVWEGALLATGVGGGEQAGFCLQPAGLQGHRSLGRHQRWLHTRYSPSWWHLRGAAASLARMRRPRQTARELGAGGLVGA